MTCRVQQMPQGSGSTQISGLTVRGLITIVSVNDTTWTALPISALADRNALGIQNTGTSPLVINFDPLVAGLVGWSVGANDSEFFTDITPSVIVYAKALTGTFDITVMEIS